MSEDETRRRGVLHLGDVRTLTRAPEWPTGRRIRLVSGPFGVAPNNLGGEDALSAAVRGLERLKAPAPVTFRVRRASGAGEPGSPEGGRPPCPGAVWDAAAYYWTVEIADLPALLSLLGAVGHDLIVQAPSKPGQPPYLKIYDDYIE